MPTWLRVTLLIVIAVWSFWIGFRYEQHVVRRVVRAARGSTWRGFGVITAYYAALLAVLAVFGLIGVIAHRAGSLTATIVTLLTGLAITAPALWFFAPGDGLPEPVTAFRDLRRQRARKDVARAIAYPALSYHVLLLWPAMIATVITVLVVA